MSLDDLLRAGSPLRYEPVSMGNGKVPEDGLPTAGAAAPTVDKPAARPISQ